MIGYQDVPANEEITELKDLVRQMATYFQTKFGEMTSEIGKLKESNEELKKLTKDSSDKHSKEIASLSLEPGQ
ncbi:hypothetical protein DXG03_006070 [Asterophora parasitica]|uniref:Uncharacterized protein n=1 Tax=Asterophora parasitica TaxID=117018 RepID=A0A9P7FYV5_9AGAR|nr:hypothetical protein DXG03_006070 [Asterophora parasitica]